MNKRLYGMAPGGRMALDRAANRRKAVWMNQRKSRARERRDDARKATVASVCLNDFARSTEEAAAAFENVAHVLAENGGGNGTA